MVELAVGNGYYLIVTLGSCSLSVEHNVGELYFFRGWLQMSFDWPDSIN